MSASGEGRRGVLGQHHGDQPEGLLFGCQTAAAAMPSGGLIINVSKIASRRGTPTNAVYCESKFGMNGHHASVGRKNLGPKGIRVNGVCPVLVSTDGLLDACADPKPPAGGNVEDWLATFAATQSALRRLPTGRRSRRSLCQSHLASRVGHHRPQHQCPLRSVAELKRDAMRARYARPRLAGQQRCAGMRSAGDRGNSAPC